METRNSSSLSLLIKGLLFKEQKKDRKMDKKKWKTGVLSRFKWVFLQCCAFRVILT